MTEDHTTEIRGEVLAKIVLTIPCEACQACIGEHCKKRGGEVLQTGLPVRVHVQRVAPVWVIYQVGYQQGRRDMKEKLSGSPRT